MVANSVSGTKLYELERILIPSESESLVDAAKRCAAMAAKLPRRAAQCKSLKARVVALRDKWQNLSEIIHAQQCGKMKLRKHAAQQRRLLRNWEHKSDKIARCLDLKAGETLVDAATRMLSDCVQAEANEALWKTRAVKAQAELGRVEAEIQQFRARFGPCLDPRNVYGFLACDLQHCTAKEIGEKATELGVKIWNEVVAARQAIAVSQQAAPSDGQGVCEAEHPA